ncbi:MULTISPECIES: hypothetical protein [Legionella]|uniref:Uncharacterized protein n=2 Tax=Legionella resiliens TaxID=2905958 RepID=A0ABS8X4C9_9GAMM|nr:MULTISPECIES: hypothetical protein [unclassified Legionella]MCE0722835.1 hypothetical protein [Legionella sp. 9fVS26]MCE3531988.1 hypothetical protein [Legionella sp. 8cVS16]QLZ68105.1 hypothetical protein FOLKNPGA_00883 [Legionella sp. PC1000]
MMKWLLMVLFFFLSYGVGANNNLNQASPKGLEAISRAATQFVSNIYSNAANLDLLSSSEGDRKAFFNKQFSATNIPCNIVKIEFLNFEVANWAMWGVQCSEKKSFIFAIKNDYVGTIKLLDCKLCTNGTFRPCLDWCTRTIPLSEVNTKPESSYVKPELANLPSSVAELSTDNVPLEQVFYDPGNRYTIKYPSAWKQWLDSSGVQKFGIPQKPWVVFVSSLDDRYKSVIELFKEKPDVTYLKNDFTQSINKNIKFLNEGPLTIKASDGSNLKAYYVIAVYSVDGFWYELLAVMVERKTAPKYLRFVYASPIAQEKDTLSIAKAMLKSWSISP